MPIINLKDGLKEGLFKDIQNFSKDVPIKWDRIVDMGETLLVYGWIPHVRRDDFVVLIFEWFEDGMYAWYITSSAKYTKKLNENLNGSENADLHTPCISYDKYFNEMIQK